MKKTEVKTNFLHRYILPRREYTVRALTDNRDEFAIEEVYYILSMAIWHTFHIEDEKLGKPFNTFFQALRESEELEAVEKAKVLDREIKFIWVCVGFLMTIAGWSLIEYVL